MHYSDTLLFCVVPVPSVTISTPPGDFYEEAPLTLTCDVDFDPSLASFVNVSVTWLRGNSPLSNTIDGISIESSLLDARLTSNVTLHSLSTADSANFTCRAGIIPSDGLTSVTASDLGQETIEIIVQSELWVGNFINLVAGFIRIDPLLPTIERSLAKNGHLHFF